MKLLIQWITGCSILTAASAQTTLLNEDFSAGLPSDWPISISVPAVTTWHAIPTGQCGVTSDALGFTGGTCSTGARGFPSHSSVFTPEIALNSSGPFVLEFESRLLMNLGFDDVSVSIVDDTASPTLLLDETQFSNTGVTELISVPIPITFAGSTISIGFHGTATNAGAGGEGWFLDNIVVTETPANNTFCFGDGVMQNCPCGNNVPAGTASGCINSSGAGAVLSSTGTASVGADTLRFDVAGGPPGAFMILASGDNQLPAIAPGAGIPAFDGLRCVGGNLIRHGGRILNAAGMNPSPWGGTGNPPQGLIAQGGFGVGQTRHWQGFYRDFADQVCMSGRNFTNAASTTFVP